MAIEKVSFHAHTGGDSPKIDPRNLLGFPIFSSVPTHIAPDGTIVLYDNEVDTRAIYVMLGGVWYSTTIT